MPTVKIDISNPIDKFNLTTEEIAELTDTVVKSVTDRYVENVKDDARLQLNKTRKAYIDGLTVNKISSGKYAVELVGWLPNAVEFGVGAFDMKEGFSRSKKRKTKANGGWYLTINMRHANPNAVASSTVFSSVMPREIHDIAKGLSKRQSLKRADLPEQYQKLDKRDKVQSGSKVFEEYKHKTTMYEGMQKEHKAGHTRYSTFRRISDESDINSWIHTGIKPKGIAQKALANTNVGFEAKRAIDTFLTDIGK